MDVFVTCREEGSGRWLDFRRPVRVLESRDASGVPGVLLEVEREARAGRWAAGFVAYEAAPAFDAALRVRPPSGPLPLAWFAVFESASPAVAVSGEADRPDWTPDITPGAHRDAVAAVKGLIERGETYQANFTFRLRARFEGDPLALFRSMAEAQRHGPMAFIGTPDWAVCSASPELFFLRMGDILVTRPMKGTAPRGRFPAEDRSFRDRLAASGKDRAENVMIVDMIRNDLGRVARTGTVHVPSPFDLEKYPTLWQMTSTVAARSHAPLPELFRALFPCASVTGAPKVRTMGILADLEASPRGVYCGTVGFLRPGGDAQFNVAIRTAVVDRRAGTAEYGTGSGIVWDSGADAEYRECLLKAQVATDPWPDFDLLETFRWSAAGGYDFLEEHLDRLMASADFFDFDLDRETVRGRLAAEAAAWSPPARRVRLLAARDGGLRVESAPMPEAPAAEPVRLAVAPAPVSSQDRFLFHKTTNRRVYDEARAAVPGADDAVLWNERGEVTETTVCNLVADFGDGRVTPPVDGGLLAGVLRRRLLETGEAREEVIPLDRLPAARGLWVANSVRGLRRAVLVDGAARRDG